MRAMDASSPSTIPQIPSPSGAAAKAKAAWEPRPIMDHEATRTKRAKVDGVLRYDSHVPELHGLVSDPKAAALPLSLRQPLPTVTDGHSLKSRIGEIIQPKVSHYEPVEEKPERAPPMFSLSTTRDRPAPHLQ